MLLTQESQQRNDIKGLFLVPYTPHAGQLTLHCVFEALKPKRIYPLVPRGYDDDLTSIIPNDLLNDGCKVIETDDLHITHEESENSFLNISEESSGSGSIEVEVSSFEEDFHSDNSW